MPDLRLKPAQSLIQIQYGKSDSIEQNTIDKYIEPKPEDKGIEEPSSP
jgi:hypothetical protein